jgi:hypothetical protein|tara:strand:- start:743 stop:865 length:123 start_codon:yes stop_codon:yes gene_type:complete
VLTWPSLDVNDGTNMNVGLNEAYLPMATPMVALAGGLAIS